MIAFRPLKRGDIPTLVMMTRENMSAYIMSSWGMEWQDEPLLEWLTDKDIETEVLEVDDGIVGYFCIEFVDNYIFITSIQLLRGHLGQGYGRLLMGEIERIASEKQAEGVELLVQDSNANAKSFYEHIGYSTICRRGNNFLMRKRLNLRDRGI